MQREKMTLSPERSARILGWGIRLLLAAVLTAARLPGGGAPFALGWLAAAGPGADGIAAALGTVVGSFLFLNFSSGLPQIAVAILICTAGSALRGLKIIHRRWFSPVCAAGFYLAVKGIYVMQSLSPLDDLAPCLMATVLTGFSAWAYAPLLHPDGEKSERAAYFLAVTVLAAFTGVDLLGIDVGRMLIGCAVLVAAWQEGAAAGMTAGLCAGFLMDLCAGGDALLFSAACGLGRYLAGMRCGKNRLSAAAVYLAAETLVLLDVHHTLGVSLLCESFLAGLLFLLIPGRVFGGKRLEKKLPEKAAVPSAMESLKEKLSGAAAAFRELYDSLGRSPAAGTEENPAVIFDRAAERVCRKCALCSLCWKQEYVSTFDALNDATPYLLERGRALPKDFPRHFSDRCIHLPDFLTAINTELSAYLLRRQYTHQLEDARQSARGQYAQLGELLAATAAGLGQDRPVAAESGRPYRIGAALRPKEGENVCGDSVGTFETDGGTLCLLLSDGSGSGEDARRESALTARLLRQFLLSGIAPEPALKTLNAALALRSAESGAFSTIDLLTVDLSSGGAVLYKYGAAPSYVKRSGAVKRITGSALPAGLKDAPSAPDVTHLTLERGSFLVMVSDGVADALSDEWLQDLLAGWTGNDPQELAGLVLREARTRRGGEDDCAVQILYLEEERVSV